MANPDGIIPGEESAILRINAALTFVSQAQLLCDRLPELHIGSPTSINLGAFGPESVAVKRQLRQDLDVLATTLRRLRFRARLPLVVGVIGRYNAGKSSLLNSFLRDLCGGTLPPALRRKVENTATDTVVTYITHPELASRSTGVDEIVTISDHNEVLRTVNFIDTPGHGWKSLQEKKL